MNDKNSRMTTNCLKGVNIMAGEKSVFNDSFKVFDPAKQKRKKARIRLDTIGSYILNNKGKSPFQPGKNYYLLGRLNSRPATR